jgi:isoleucyl-tRNA synthetase
LQVTKRKFFSTLSNSYSCFATYANIDGFQYDTPRIPVSERTELDRWIISRLNNTILEADQAYADYNATKAGRAVENLVDDLSNWYVRRSRRRLWRSGQGHDKTSAYQTLFECLVAIAKMMSPIAPFYSEWLYRALTGISDRSNVDSVHLADFPSVENEALDPDLEHRMDLARTIASIALSLRNQSKINVRQPLSRILVVTGTGVEQEAVEQMQDVIVDEVNIKTIEYLAGSSGLVEKSAKPNFKLLGQRLGKHMKSVNQIVRSFSTANIEAYEQNGSIDVDLDDGTSVTLGPDDLDITSQGIEGWLVEQQNGVTVALDTTLTDTLRSEGLAREFVNRVQNARKLAGLEITDRVQIRYSTAQELAAAIEVHAAWIRNETLATQLERTKELDGAEQQRFDIADTSVSIVLEKLN